MPNPMPENTNIIVQDYFNTHIDEIETNLMAYAGFQKMMVRQAMGEQLSARWCQRCGRNRGSH